MRLNRFIGEYDLSLQQVEIIDHDTVKQIRNVLKLKVGEKIILGDGEEREAEVIIFSITSKSVIGIIEKIKHVEENKRKVNLYLAILKKENFELAVQKAVEVGVSHIIPVITERTIKTGINMERLNKIIKEASEQSDRSIVPTLSPIMKFQDALIDGLKTPTPEVGVPTKKVGIIFHLTNTLYSPSTSSGSTTNKKAYNISIFIGPEGGFTEKEINNAKDASYDVASLGSSTLRGETAAIVATYRAVNGI